MKKIMLIACVAVLLIAAGTPFFPVQKTGDVNGLIIYKGYLGTDSGFVMSGRDTSSLPGYKLRKGLTVFDHNNLMWIYTGTHWVAGQATGGGGGSETLDQVLGFGNTSTKQMTLTTTTVNPCISLINNGGTGGALFINTMGGGYGSGLFVYDGNQAAATVDPNDVAVYDGSRNAQTDILAGYWFFRETSNNWQQTFNPPYVLGNYDYHPPSHSCTFADSADVTALQKKRDTLLTATGTGSAVSFSYTISTGHTFACFQAQNTATPAVLYSSISGTTLTITCVSAPVLSASVAFGGFFK